MSPTIAICQVRSSENLSGNLKTVEKVVSKHPAELYLFPELFLTHYGITEVNGLKLKAAMDILEKICRRKGVALAMGLCVAEGGHRYNSLCFMTPTGTKRYDKLYLANFEPYNEGVFTAGSSTTLIEWNGLKLGLEICYDVMFPEIHRDYAVNGADLILVSSASSVKSEHAMNTILPARSLENTVYTAYCNNVGTGPAGKYFGGSALYSPLGEIVAKAGEEEEVLIVKVDRSEIEASRRIRHHLADLRSDITWK